MGSASLIFYGKIKNSLTSFFEFTIGKTNFSKVSTFENRVSPLKIKAFPVIKSHSQKLTDFWSEK